MNRSLLALLAFPLLTLATGAQATTVNDPVGDFLPSYVGPHDGDLDVTSFSVNYDPSISTFIIGGTLAGAIDPSTPGFYVVGVNTGTGVIAPFASIGAPNVIFNQAIRINKDATGAIGGTALLPGTISINGNSFSALIPLSLLPSTGFSALNYGFNLWPRIGLGNNNQISDFAPDNANISPLTPVPEPSTWAMMLLGFGAIGIAMRRRTRATNLHVA